MINCEHPQEKPIQELTPMELVLLPVAQQALFNVDVRNDAKN